ncbi:OmpA family protein [bacterium]|nr:OmpA family protein [bacterium]RQV97936.1 MAG: chemotaxis protein MotB [bacterium]
MKIAISLLSVILIVSLAAGGYLYLNQVQPLQKAQNQLQAINSELTNDIQALENELNQTVKQLNRTQQEKEDEITLVKSTKDSLIAEMQSEIQDNQIQITQLADKLKVSIVDKILFPSGEADISPEGLAVLKRVGEILKKSENKIIRVEGHTDNMPIKRKKDQFPTNWELSTARATNVVRFLQDEVNMDPTRLEAVGLGEYHPVAGNDTKENRAKNRRIEIALLPVK